MEEKKDRSAGDSDEKGFLELQLTEVVKKVVKAGAAMRRARKATRKRYVVPGLLDFRLLARIGKAWTMVDFTGGRSSGYGIRWASLTTDDPVLQVLIESSKEFRDQKIIKQSL
ncbi:MAG: hypothetical protein K1W02_05785 [Muribaculaceae bacterium]